MATDSFFQRRLARTKMLFTNGYFWGGLVVLLAIGFGVYLLFNDVLMPSYTRQEVSVTVPDVRDLPFEEAARLLAERQLEANQQTQRFNPTLPRDVVVDQIPPPNTQVKPGRNIFLTINSGTVPEVVVPRVEGFSKREAQNRVIAVGLSVELRPDSIPAGNINTITRQRPAPGAVLPEGETVTLWFATGLGSQYVQVPSVTGQTAQQATRRLLGRSLRARVVGSSDDESARIVRQSPEAGTRVRQGSEIRLFLPDADG